MSVFGCNFCGERLYYHGEPEGDVPVEHYFCTLENWRSLEQENLPADCLENEHEEFFFYAWRCWRCGSFLFSADYIHIWGVYTPKEDFSFEPMQEPFEFGPFWDDFQWFDITENGTPASEVLTRYPQTRWLAKNDDELRIYSDIELKNCIAQFRRIEFVNPVTVATMSLDAFKKMLARWDDIQFRYHSKLYNYNFMREENGVNIYRGLDNEQLVYHAETTDVEEIVNAKIFPGGKSIAEAQAEVEL